VHDPPNWARQAAIVTLRGMLDAFSLAMPARKRVEALTG
jgi:hypothetical protein